MTTTTSTFQPGDRVRFVNGTSGTVWGHGPCSWPQCKHGDDCVVVKFDDNLPSRNVNASLLTLLVEGPA